MLHELLKDMNIDKAHNYRYLETAAIESACSEIEVAQLEQILRKYTSTADMFTQQYLHGKNENIKLLVGENYTVVDVTGDGSCGPRAIAMGLRLLGGG